MKNNLFDEIFSLKSIKEKYENKIVYKATQGLDKITKKNFNNNLIHNLEIIQRKVLNTTYNFTKYKELLILKGKNKTPRVISRPTIRDRITLSLLHEYLKSVFCNNLDNKIIQTKINEIINRISEYSYYIKIDIKKFYSSINHDILLEKLKNKIDSRAFSLISKAISTSTIAAGFYSKKREIEPNKLGIPEGLAISNILANIYMLKFDNSLNNMKNIYYSRYVDDILILCKDNKVDDINNHILSFFSILALESHDILNKDKMGSGLISNGFSYLGYDFAKKLHSEYIISVRKSSIEKFELSLENLFSKHNKNTETLDLFIWKLNLKITGCIFDNNKYGWLFFYSQINNKTLLKHLDWLIKKFFIRFNIEQEQSLFPVKTMSKTYYEIKYNLSKSDYLLNCDKLKISEKVNILKTVFKKDINFLEENIEKEFSRIIRVEIKELEKDVQFFY